VGEEQQLRLLQHHHHSSLTHTPTHTPTHTHTHTHTHTNMKLTVTPSMMVLALLTELSRDSSICSCNCVARFLSSIFSRHMIPRERACEVQVEFNSSATLQKLNHEVHLVAGSEDLQATFSLKKILQHTNSFNHSAHFIPLLSHTPMHTHPCTHTHAHTHQCTHTPMHTHQCTHTPMHTHQWTHTPMHTHPCTHTHANAHTPMHTQLQS